MSRGLLPAAVFVTAAVQLTYGLLVDERTPIAWYAALALGALVAYARRNAVSPSRTQTWTIAGLSLLTMAAVADGLDSLAPGRIEGAVWVTGRLLLTAGVATLAAALLIRTGLPSHRRMIPAFVVTFGAVVTAWTLAAEGPAQAGGQGRTWLLTLIALGVAAAGFAANAALTGARRMLAAGLGLLPVAALLAGAMAGASDTGLFDRPVTDTERYAYLDPLVDTERLQAAIQPDPLGAAYIDASERTYTITATVHAYTVLADEPEGDPKGALEAGIVLAGLFALALALFPPTGGIALYSYRSDG